MSYDTKSKESEMGWQMQKDRDRNRQGVRGRQADTKINEKGRK